VKPEITEIPGRPGIASSTGFDRSHKMFYRILSCGPELLLPNFVHLLL